MPQQPRIIDVTPYPIWFRGLFSGEFASKGFVESESRLGGDIEYGVRLENGNFFWAKADQIKARQR